MLLKLEFCPPLISNTDTFTTSLVFSITKRIFLPSHRRKIWKKFVALYDDSSWCSYIEFFLKQKFSRCGILCLNAFAKIIGNIIMSYYQLGEIKTLGNITIKFIPPLRYLKKGHSTLICIESWIVEKTF